EHDTASEEVVLEGSRHLGVLGGQDLLAADDEGHLRAERREHVDKFDAGDARADDDEVTGNLRGWVGLAGGEDAVAVRLAPVREAGPAPRGEENGVGLELLDARPGLDDHLVRALEPAAPEHHADALALEQVDDAFVE